MNFEQALRAELINLWLDIELWDDSEVHYEILDRVFPNNAPKGTKAPYLTYETGDLSELKTMEGYGSSGTHQSTVDVFGATYTEMKSIAKKVKQQIKSFQSRSIGIGGPYIQNVTFEDLAPEQYEPNVNLHRKSITFTVFY